VEQGNRIDEASGTRQVDVESEIADEEEGHAEAGIQVISGANGLQHAGVSAS